MRRRVWAFIRQFDILISFQVGLPSMMPIRSHESALLPRNIYDDDGSFSETSTQLPPRLPDSEPTQISYLISKTRLAFGFARAVDELDRLRTVPFERLLEIDRELRQIYNSIPDYHKVAPLSCDDSLIVTSARFVLASIHHRTLCVVHSRFLDLAQTDQRYQYSRRVCLTSAMTILRFQFIQNQDIPVDGRLRSLTNYQTSFAIHDYLLAATIISTELCSNNGAGRDGSARNQLRGIPSRADMVKALEVSARIFDQMKDQSMEAYKAADVLSMLVKKLKPGGRCGQCKQTPWRVETSQSLRSRFDGPTLSADFAHKPEWASHALPITPESSSGSGLASHAERPTPMVSYSFERARSPLNQTDLNGPPAWTEPLDAASIMESSFMPQPGLDLEASLDWNVPELSPYQPSFALSDPISALWNLNSGM
jgi:hypothetical protein